MLTVKQEYKQFLNDNFNGLVIRKPLFYNWQIGLRFDLQVGETNTDSYFKEVVDRASTLFQASFEQADDIFFLLQDYKWKRRKISTSNYGFKQIKNLNESEISFSQIRGLYDSSDKFDIRNVALIKTTVAKINYTNLLTAIAHSDFPYRQPRLDDKGMLTDKEIYFLNIDKRLIFHMYDDRGLDIISSDVQRLQPIYERYNDWILNYDRARIDKIFNKNGIQHQADLPPAC